MPSDIISGDSIANPVAIFGWGLSGQAAAMLLNKYKIDYEVFDQDGRNITRDTFTQEDAGKYKTVVYSPGFRQDHPWLKLARHAQCRCMGELDFASLFLGSSIIAVTGTNGKTTLTEFLAHALNKNNIKASVAGNMGYSLSRLAANEDIDNEITVCETSSFQSECLTEMEIDALLWTNFSEDHLDQHSSMEEYFDAKWNLINCLSKDMIIAGESVFQAAATFGKKLPDYTQIVKRGDLSEIPANTVFRMYPQQENYLIAKRYWDICGYDKKVIEEAARDFTLPSHRLKQFTNIDSIEYWNDSKSTNFSSTIAALHSFDKPVYWIGGGKSKGGDLENFSNSILPHLKEAFLIGEVAEDLEALLYAGGCEAYVCRDMEQALSYASDRAIDNSIVLLSPGFSSFDQFDNYQQRGIIFEKTVMSIKKSNNENVLSTPMQKEINKAKMI